MLLLAAFLFRLLFGLAGAMALVPTRFVPAGYYRVHSYVLLGLAVVAALAAIAPTSGVSLWPPVAAGACSYLSVVAWHFQRPRLGLLALVGVALFALIGMGRLVARPETDGALAVALNHLAPATSGALLGTTLAAMFLGHYYLNTPTMQLAPLRRLVLLMGALTVAHALICGVAWGSEWSVGLDLSNVRLMLGILRWLAGLVGTFCLVLMTWHTLKIPNTQAATGMLYVAVITTLLGELSGMLLSGQARFPL